MQLNTSKTEIIVAMGVLQLLMLQLGMAKQACDMHFKSGSGSNSMGRIVGGEAVGEHELPYQLLLVNQKGSMCGAVVLNTSHAITASHCTEGSRPSQFFIYGGVRNRSEYKGDILRGREDPNVQVRTVSKIIQHPRYAKKSEGISEKAYLKNDISLLEISEPFKINKYVRPIKLATKDTKLPSSGVISGWGCTDQNIQECHTKKETSPQILQKATVSIYKDQECAASFKGNNIFTYQVCVGDAGKGACLGDSGGPLVIENEGEKLLVGITSFVVGNCACEGYPAVYTEVSHFLPWIHYGIDDTPEEIVGGNDSIGNTGGGDGAHANGGGGGAGVGGGKGGTSCISAIKSLIYILAVSGAFFSVQMEET